MKHPDGTGFVITNMRLHMQLLLLPNTSEGIFIAHFLRLASKD